MEKRVIIRDSILKKLEEKTKSWKKKYFRELTETKITPNPKEIHNLACLFTVTNESYSIRNSYLKQMEIIPPTTYNTLALETRIGNKEGTGFAVKTRDIEEGNPRDIPLDSLELNLEILHNDTRRESYENFHNRLYQTNTLESRKYQQSVLKTPTSKRKFSRTDLFYHLEPRKPSRFIQENNEQRVPSSIIQGLLSEISKELIGENEINKNGFEASATIGVVNETSRIANSEGSMIRESFTGYKIHYSISFDSPSSGKSEIGWRCGIDKSDIRKQREFLKKKARELNSDYNDFFNNKDAVSIPTGPWEVYLEPENFGVHIHEAIVHACSSRSIVQHLRNPDEEAEESAFTIRDINTLVANPNLQILCNPRKKQRNGKPYWGGAFYDHEATETRRFHILKNGTLTNLLADRSDSYLINSMLGKNVIKPGSSRFGISENSDVNKQEPRTSILEVRWTEKGAENLTRDELWRKFKKRIKEHGRIPYKGETRKAGLWIKGGYTGEFTEQGLSKAYYNPAYLTFEDGTYLPIGDFLYTSNSPRTILEKVKGVGSKREQISGRCAVGEDVDYIVRESIFCGPAIISGLEIKKVSQLAKRFG